MTSSSNNNSEIASYMKPTFGIPDKTVGHHAETANTFHFNNLYKLKLISKKLASGKCQVKFFATLDERRRLYGYTLVEASMTLKEVVHSITNKLKERQDADKFYHAHLYAIRREAEEINNFMIFDM